jgi:hypothetical protein
LVECPQFVKLLQVSFDTGEIRHRIVDKELVLEPFGTKKPRKVTNDDTHGYDVQLVHATAALTVTDNSQSISDGTPDVTAMASIPNDAPSFNTPGQMMQ